MISAEFVLDLDSLDNSNAFWYTKDVNDERQFNPTSRLVSMYLLLSDVCNIVFYKHAKRNQDTSQYWWILYVEIKNQQSEQLRAAQS